MGPTPAFCTRWCQRIAEETKIPVTNSEEHPGKSIGIFIGVDWERELVLLVVVLSKI
jgi:hypothetical protein